MSPQRKSSRRFCLELFLVTSALRRSRAEAVCTNMLTNPLKKSRTLSTLLVIVLLAAVATAIWYFAGSPEKRSDLSADLRSDLSSPEIYPDTIPESEQKKLDLPQTFSHPDFKFSFSYPAGFTASRLPKTEGGETIVVQDTKRQAGFQIHLESYDDPDTDITAERLARDIPEMIVKEPREVLIGSSGKGLAWTAEDTGTREVWFIFRGVLYQITAPLSNDTLLQKVLNTWSFE